MRPMHARPTALLLDDRPLLRLGLRTLLEAQHTIRVVAEAGTLAEAVTHAAHLRPDLVIAAAALADGDVAEACRRLTEKAPGTRVAVLLDEAAGPALADAARAGVCGCLTLGMPGPDLCRAVRGLATGQSRLDPRALSAPRDHLFALTPQERRVLALVAEGKTNKEIGAALGLSEKTVKNYLSHAFEKLQVSRRAQAAVLAAGLTPPARAPASSPPGPAAA
jgi:two-component system response regulator DevR